MAKVINDPKSLPARKAPIPGAKPPVYKLPFKDSGSPNEVDAFLEEIRRLRRQSQARPR